MKNNQIVLIHGTGYQEMTETLLERIDLAADIPGPDCRIGVKPNLVVAAKASGGAVTHPEMVAGVLAYLQRHGFRRIEVLDGSWVGDSTERACEVSGIGAVCRKYGVPFTDLQRDAARPCDAAGLPMRVCARALDTEFLINMPVLKGHCQTKVTCALKNLKGLLPNAEKRRFHALGLHKPIAHLNTVLTNGLILVDNICGDLDFEEGGNPVTMDRIFACKDPVLCDAFACRVMGYRSEEVPYIGLAEQLGVGCADLSKAELIALNEGSAEEHASSRRVQALGRCIAPREACSACYGSLIYALSRMEQRGTLRDRREKLCIGQGYRGESGEIGIGSCTCGFHSSLPGCPPQAAEILDFLENCWK